MPKNLPILGAIECGGFRILAHKGEILGEGDAETLERCNDRIDTHCATGFSRSGKELIEGFVVVRGVVVKQDQLSDFSSSSDTNGVVDSAVTPGWLTRELFGRVLRVVDKNIDALTEFKNSRLDGNSIRRLLMIAHIGHRETIALDSISERGVCMWNFERRHFRSRYLVNTFSKGEERNIAGEILTSNREKRWTHQVVKSVGESDTVMVWPVDRKCRTRYQQRLTERKPLDVVPVKVRHECVRMQLHTGTLVGTEVSESGSEVEQDRIGIVAAQYNARGIAAVTRRAFTSTWRRPPNSVKRDLHCPPPPRVPMDGER